MSGITIMSKQPPGGRCSLYMRYAETLKQHLGIEFDIRFCDDGVEVPPPAMLIDDVLVAPSDGVILSPEDIAASLRNRLTEDQVARLGQLLEETQERWMEEWSDA